MNVKKHDRVSLARGSSGQVFVVVATFSDHDAPRLQWLVVVDEADEKKRERRVCPSDVVAVLGDA